MNVITFELVHNRRVRPGIKQQQHEAPLFKRHVSAGHKVIFSLLIFKFVLARSV